MKNFIKNYIKYSLLITLVSISSLSTQVTYSAIGCMDNSLHGGCSGGQCTVRKDSKVLQYVSCPCPCEWITEKRGQCLRCRHYGNPQRGLNNALHYFEPVFS